MKLTAVIQDPNCAFFKVPTAQEYQRCLAKYKGHYNPKKIQSKVHGNTKGEQPKQR